MQDDERKTQVKEVANRFRLICNEQIEEIEDRLPKVSDPLERDDLLKRIAALEQIADEANARAEEMIKVYYCTGLKK
jgi:uncharacterized protein Yka (UPF0111/DUF47 family)